MPAIWKFEIEAGGYQKNFVPMPMASKILSTQMQDGKLMVWALVVPSMRQVNRVLTVRGTGFPISGSLGTYVGTAQDGEYVWHVFDEGEV